MKAINPNATRDYICECDKDLPAAEQTVFEIVQLTAEEQAYLKDIDSLSGSQINNALHLGLAGVRNLPDAQGNAIKLQRDTQARIIHGKKKPWANLTVIPMKERDEVAAQIIKGADLEGDTVKNS